MYYRFLSCCFSIAWMLVSAYFLHAQSPNNSPGLSFSERLNTAKMLVQERKYAEANTAYLNLLFDKTLTLSTKEKAFLYLQRSRCQERMNADSSALESVSSSLDLLPDPEAYYTRAGVYLRSGLSTFAMADIEKAIRLVPDKADYYLLRGNIHFQLGTKPEGCADMAMAKILGLNFPDDISNETCRLLGVPLETKIGSSGDAEPEARLEAHQRVTQTVANDAVQSLIAQTNNLNTSFYRFWIQAMYGSTTTMLSRLFYDVSPGRMLTASTGYALSRDFAVWGGATWFSLPYTFASERSQLAETPPPPFGAIVSLSALVGAQYSMVINNSIDAQLGVGIGYRTTQFPVDVPIAYKDGRTYRANLGIREANGFVVQSSLGAEWRFLRYVALTGNALFTLSFSQYNFLTLGRLDRENVHQFIQFAGGLRFYFGEQGQ